MPSPRCARRSTSCATTRRRSRGLRQRDAPAARPRRLHQPVELSAGDLHRPGRGGARRRQRGARQAGRGDAADRRRRPCACCTRPACRRTRCSCCPATARSARALVGDARVAGRGVHRLDRGRAADPAPARRAPEPDGRPIPLIAETGGQNAMIVDSSALAEQVVADVLDLGLRSRRPALLGAARALPAGGRRRPHARDAEGRDGRAVASAIPTACRPMSARSSPAEARDGHRWRISRRCAHAGHAVHQRCRCRTRPRTARFVAADADRDRRASPS